jgi:hypothetical protein
MTYGTFLALMKPNQCSDYMEVGEVVEEGKEEEEEQEDAEE